MRRRTLLAMVGGAVGFAGCTGGGESTDDSGEKSQTTPTPTPTPTPEPTETSSSSECNAAEMAREGAISWGDKGVNAEGKVQILAEAKNNLDYPVEVIIDVDFHESDARNAPAVKSREIDLGVLEPDEVARDDVIVDEGDIVTYSTDITTLCP